MSDEKINRATQRSLAELARVISPFSEHWEEWNKSDYAVLSKKEFLIIDSYRKNKSHRHFAEENHFTRRHVAVIYSKAIQKLRLVKTTFTYRKWLVYKSLKAEGLAKSAHDINSLVDPATHMKMPLSLFLKLYQATSGKEPTIIEHQELAELELLHNISSMQAHDLRKQNICIYLYITPNE